MFQTNPDDPRTEAQQVAAYEKRNRPEDKKRSRLSLHINWDDRFESEMLYCESFRLLPRGMCRKIILKFLDTLVGECKDKAEVVRVLNAWAKATHEQARDAIVKGAPQPWRDERPARSTRTQAAAQAPMQQQEFLRRMRHLMQQTEAMMAAQPEASWEGVEADDAPPVPTKPPRSHPEPVETPPPGRAPTQQGFWLDSF